MGQETPITGNRAYRIYSQVMGAIGTAIAYFFIYVLVTGLALAFLAPWFEEALPKARWVDAVMIAVAHIPTVAVFYFRWRGARWRKANPELHAAREAAKLARIAENEAKAKAAIDAPLSEGQEKAAEIIEGIGRLILLIVGIVVGVIVLYIGFQLITSMSVPVAILVGAIFIGLCILAAASR